MHERNLGFVNALATLRAQKARRGEGTITDIPFLLFKIRKSTEQQLWLVDSAHGDLHRFLTHEYQLIGNSEPGSFLPLFAAALGKH